MDDAWAAFRAQCGVENDLLYNKLVAEVAFGKDALLDDVGRLVHAEIQAEVEPLVEVQAKTQHKVAERGRSEAPMPMHPAR